MTAGWERTSLSEAFIIKPSKKEAKQKLDGTDLVSFVPMNDIGEAEKYFQPKEERSLDDVVGSYTYFADSDVLLAKITPCFENGKLGIAKGLTNGIGFGSSEYIVFRSTGKGLPEYLYYYLARESFREEGKRVMSGAVGHKRVPKDFIENYQIPLPPQKEQQRIVAILDEAFAGIATATANVEKNLQNARELFERTLQSVFAEKGEGWEEKCIDEITTVINGYAFKSTDFSEKNSVNSVKITNVGVREFVTASNNNLPSGFEKEYGKVKVSEGDIVIALTRSIISSGLKVAFVPSEYDGALLNQRVAALRINKGVVSPNFLYAYLCSSFVIEYVKKQANTLMQPNLSITDLKSMPVSLPSLDVQMKVVERLERLSSETRRLESLYQKKLDDLAELKQSILQKAFAGELH